MLSGSALEAAVNSLSPVPLTHTYARRVDLRALMLATPSASSSVPQFLKDSIRAYRYNQAGVRSLYLGESEDVAGAEVKQHPGLGGLFGTTPSAPAVIFHIDVQVSGILDVTLPAVQTALNTTTTELTQPWRLHSPNAVTQLLGKAVFDSKLFEGIRYQSAPMFRAGQTGYCLVLFRDRKALSSIVKLYDPTGTWSESW